MFLTTSLQSQIALLVTLWILSSGSAISVIAAPANPAAASLVDAQNWMKEVAAPFREGKDLELSFAASVQMPDAESPERYVGSLWVGDSLRFRLEIPTGTYACDGITFWEYHPRTKQALKRSAQDLAGRALPGRILFELLASTPLSCDTLKVQEKTQVRLRLAPALHAGQMDSLSVRIDPKRRKLESVETLDANGVRTRYELKVLKPKAGIPSSRFRFEPPASAEVVDMQD